jgi:hypothetical protein
VGDQFARAVVYGRYKIIPLHAEIIGQGEELGFDFMGAIIWQKKTTINTTGGAPIMGSYPYPPNGLVEIDYEFILILKKPGPGKKVAKAIKEASKLTKEEWKEYFSGHWHFGGARQLGHEAMFPEELPRRLILMFTFTGDTVLDPFLGSGTTVKAALELGRNAVGFEINDTFEVMIREKLGMKGPKSHFKQIHIIRRAEKTIEVVRSRYKPRIQDSQVLTDPADIYLKTQDVHKVIDILDEKTIKLDNGAFVDFLGVLVDKGDETRKYLQDYVLGKTIILKETHEICRNGVVSGYVYLKNKIFINAYLIKSGLASPDDRVKHRYSKKFRLLAEKAEPASSLSD